MEICKKWLIEGASSDETRYNLDGPENDKSCRTPEIEDVNQCVSKVRKDHDMGNVDAIGTASLSGSQRKFKFGCIYKYFKEGFSTSNGIIV